MDLEEERLSIRGCEIGDNVTIYDFCNLYGCSIGDGTKIGTFVEIQKDAFVGKNCVISSHTFVCSGVTIEDGVFVGHGVMFCNDKTPIANNPKWKMLTTRVGSGASIGNGSTILPGVTIGKNALIGAGSVVTKDVPEGETWAGNPARKL